jgi:hypothetical protein
MKASTVVSTVAALSMASVLGIAYAQSTYSDPQTGTTSQGTTNQGTTGTMNQQDATGTTTQGSSSMDSRSDMGSTSTSRSQPMYNERVARADRN